MDNRNLNPEESDTIWKLETNLDDCSGEVLGFTMERLLEAGARDVNYTPVFMKKNRPAYELHVLCREEDIFRMEEIIFANTTTIGIRRCEMQRTILQRENLTIDSSFGLAQVKVCRWSGNTRYYPEYESVAAICRAKNLNYQDVYAQLQQECRQKAR